MKNPEILVIDDEKQIQKLLAITLQTNDYKVNSAFTAKEGLILAKNHIPDLILLDIGLPDKSGHEVLKELRVWYTKPIIILSVNNAEEDIVRALDNGANDYLAKPFRSGELIARIRSSLRGSFLSDSKPSCINELEINFDLRVVKKNNTPIKLTATEYNLLTLFVKNEGRVLTHQYLLREIWGPGYIEQSQYLRVFIAQLRKKIETEPNHPEYILTESGVGYRFVDKEQTL
ncbi:MAG: response regulator transcription factor [Bacteroidetes bacterium]|nr:response regulator transcription factor [Bacteroidota bacterium]